MHINDKHFYLTSSADILDICQPLVSCFNISYFNYVAIKNKKIITLSTNPEWQKCFFDNKLYKDMGVLKKEKLHKGSYILWSEFNNPDQAIIVGREDFNIDNGLTIMLDSNNTTEYYYFGTSRENMGINNFYVHNIDLFHRFIVYFKDKAIKILNEAEKFKLSLDMSGVNKDQLISYTSNINIFLNKVKPRRVFLQELNQYLTLREVQCLYFISIGLSSKAIANKLNLSSRTVETYVEKLKFKLNIDKKKGLCEFINNNDLSQTLEILI